MCVSPGCVGVLCLSYSLHPLGIVVRGSSPDGCDSVSLFLSHPDGGVFAPWIVGGEGVLPRFPSWGGWEFFSLPGSMVLVVFRGG
jgi:hypothetical protein